MCSPMAATFRELLTATKKEIREVSTEHVQGLLAARAPLKLIDVREGDEYAAGRLPGALHIPRGLPRAAHRGEGRRATRNSSSTAPAGTRSALAAAHAPAAWATPAWPRSRAATTAGATRASRWRSPWCSPPTEGALPPPPHPPRGGRGGAGQAAPVPGAAVGRGRPRLARGALPRRGGRGHARHRRRGRGGPEQPAAPGLHTQARAGQPKVESARAALEALNPDVKVVPFGERLTADNVLRILEGFDLVLDGGDNFPTRYLLNDACVMQRQARHPRLRSSASRAR